MALRVTCLSICRDSSFQVAYFDSGMPINGGSASEWREAAEGTTGRLPLICRPYLALVAGSLPGPDEGAVLPLKGKEAHFYAAELLGLLKRPSFVTLDGPMVRVRIRGCGFSEALNAPWKASVS